MRAFIIPLVLAALAALVLLRPSRQPPATAPAVEPPGEVVPVETDTAVAAPVATPAEEANALPVSTPEPTPRLAPQEVLYVIKRFSEPSKDGGRGFSRGDEVRFVRQEAGYYVVSDGVVEARRPRSWFTRDLDLVEEMRQEKLAASSPGEGPKEPAPASPALTKPAVPAAASPEPRAPSSAGPPAGTDPRLWAAARTIDQHLAKFHEGQKRPEPVLVPDEKFLRRAYLVTVGRIPTVEEARAFLSSDQPGKRPELIARLIKSPGYASHMSNWAFDRLRVVDHKVGQALRFDAYRNWVREAVEQNMPWDKMVAALLTAKGDGWNEQTAAVGYYTRDRGMPLDHMATAMRVFLGSSMECAQCHNDPFGDTKQKDFFRLAAFTNGTDSMHPDLMLDLFREMSERSQTSLEYEVAWLFWRDIYGMSLAGGGTGRIVLPLDYRYHDAHPGDIEGARSPFGKIISMTGQRDRDDGRQRLAEWMTTGTGDRFPTMIANLLWQRVIGVGIFEPADDYIEFSETENPLLTKYLATLMTSLNYNLQDFQHALLLTRAFEYETAAGPSQAPGGSDDFRGRRVARLSAEQVWDSLVTLVAGNPDGQPRRPVDQTIYLSGRPILEGKMDMKQLSREVLGLKSEEEVRAYFNVFLGKVRAEQEAGVSGDMGSPSMRQGPVDFVRGSFPRASELPSPAPADHFLTLFGQSTREVVDGATREPNIGQVLALMNGFVQRELIGKPEAQLNLGLAALNTPEDKVRQLYLAVLSREPSAGEMELMLAEFQTAPETAPANIAAAMVMSAEFLYLQ
ncbi:MAG: DUF1549 domain-containing protein [Chthoniobacterales bacterium]